MAKKKETLTPEERLQAALVPESEQPYPVPGNWCWVKLSSLSQVISKGTTPKGGKSAYSDHGVKFLRVENINDDGTISHENIAYVSEELHCTFLKRSILEENDILVSIAGTLGKTGIVRSVDLPMNTNQAVAFVRIALDKINRRYIKNAIDNPVIQNLLLGKTKVTSIPNLTLEIIGECPIPLPPFAEQQRIVDRIESLFAKLDEAKQKAQDALDSFETRKAAILHKAFTGELTAQWRKEHGMGMESWEKLKIGTYAQVKGGKRLPKGHKLVTERTAHPYLRIADFGDGTINDSDLHYITEDTFSQIKNYIINKEDVYISIVGSIGKAGVIPESLNGSNLTENAARIISSRTLPRYLSSFLSSPKAQNDIQNRIRSATLGKLSLLNIKDIETSIPSIEEQTEIIRILDDLLAKEQQAKDAAEGVLEQIDLIKKAILARAFRGELGTNDPNEGNAAELLCMHI